MCRASWLSVQSLENTKIKFSLSYKINYIFGSSYPSAFVSVGLRVAQVHHKITVGCLVIGEIYVKFPT